MMNIDPVCFKAFQSAALHLNFTEAARVAGMTQSGVSQHISRLESGLGTELFHRVGKKVILTEAGQQLLKFIDGYYDSLQALGERIHETQALAKGKVRYAMPASCLLSPHFSILLTEKRKNFPEVQLQVDLMPSDDVINAVLENRIDFGFITKKSPNDLVNYAEFCDEEYALYSAPGTKVDLENLNQSRWISYPGHEVMLEKWLKHHKVKKDLSIGVQGETNSIHTALTMVAHGLGVAVFPTHCAEATPDHAQLKMHFRDPKKCRNTIYIATLANLTPPLRVKKVIATFLAMK